MELESFNSLPFKRGPDIRPICLYCSLELLRLFGSNEKNKQTLEFEIKH